MKNVFANKIFKKVANILSTVLLIFSITVCALVIVSAKSSRGIANVFGFSVLSVQSDSMEPTFYENDLIVIRRTDTKRTRRDNYQVGDVVSFVAYDQYGARFINTHRIYEVIEGSSTNRYVTKGDHEGLGPDDKKLYASDIIGVYAGKSVAGMGVAFDFIKTSAGVMLFVVLPAALIVAWQLFSYLKSLSETKASSAALTPTAAPASAPIFMPERSHTNVNKQAVISEYIRRQEIIDEYLRSQQEEEMKKQAIIDEYLANQRAAEKEAKAAAAEEERIKAIIAEFLAQQKNVEQGENAEQGESVEQGESAESDVPEEQDTEDKP